MRTSFGFVTAAVLMSSCAVEEAGPTKAEFATVEGALGSSGIVINEFRPGRTGWVELYNTTNSAKDISSFLAMNNGYNAMAKSYVAPAGTKIAAKSRLVVPLNIRSTVPDGVHLLDHGGLYGAVDNEQDNVGVFKLPSGSTKCFARQPDGGPWASGGVPCSKGSANAGTSSCSPGAACDDGDPCTKGEVWSASCTCGGGKAMYCNDGNACTTDACVNGTCKNTASYVATACGNAGTCKLGVCTTAGTTPGTCTDQGGTIEGVTFTPAQACKAVAFMNGAKFSELDGMGDHPRVVIYDSGPGGYGPYHPGNWQFVTQFANVNLIGKTALTQLRDMSAAWTAGGKWYDTVAAAFASKASGVRFTFEKVWMSKVVGTTCYEIRDTPTATGYLTACTSPCASDSCTNSSVPDKVGQFIWVRGRLEYSTSMKKWLVANAYWKDANPKL